MKRILLFSLVMITASATAQQFSPRTHFFQNYIVYNPAVAGTEDEVPIRLNFRQQWTGLKDAPYSQTLTSHGFVGKNVGLGVVLYNDAAGPIRNTGFQAAAARHFALDKDSKRWFSFGMSLILYQYKFDTDRLRTDIPNDPAVLALASQDSRLTPDIAAGVYLNDDNGFVGISCQNLIQNKSDLLDQTDNINSVERTYYLIGGYKFPLNDKTSIEPLTMIKVTEAMAWQADVMVRINYDKWWGGLSYRTGDAASILAGVRIDVFSFAYSYDYPITGLGNFNSGTHEITAGVYLFNAISKKGPLEKVESGRRRSGGFNPKGPRKNNR